MSNWEWAFYVGMALAYGWAFDFSVKPSMTTKAGRIMLVIISIILGAAWIIAMPIFSFYEMFSAGQRGRS